VVNSYLDALQYPTAKFESEQPPSRRNSNSSRASTSNLVPQTVCPAVITFDGPAADSPKSSNANRGGKKARPVSAPRTRSHVCLLSNDPSSSSRELFYGSTDAVADQSSWVLRAKGGVVLAGPVLCSTPGIENLNMLDSGNGIY
jgi:hypothetical protein